MLDTAQFKHGKVLIVDDDLNLLSSIKRSLKPLQEDYDIRLLNKGSNACQLIETEKFDLIISDLMMPEVNGFQVIETARESNPQAVRILVSGQPEHSVSSASYHIAHRYISKPFRENVLIEMIKEVCNAKKISLYSKVSGELTSGELLPSKAISINLLKNELAKLKPDIYSIAEIITSDTVMTARLYQLLSQSTEAEECGIFEIAEIVKKVSQEKIRSLIFDSQVINTAEQLKIFYPIDKFSDYSRSVAIRAQWLAEAQLLGSFQANKYFVAGLLHNIGELLLASYDYQKYLLISLMQQEEENQAEKVQSEVLGASYAAIGAELLSKWGIPKLIVKAIASQNEEISKITEEWQIIAQAVKLAKAMTEKKCSDNRAKEILSRMLTASLFNKRYKNQQ